MEPILCGLETEYGFYVEGRSAEDQIDDAAALVRSYPGECFPFWDYRFESPRLDLRGFALDRLAVDPNDARYDRGRVRGHDHEVRSDRVLPNGARFYNDHGHPEYATPECNDAFECAMHDRAGQLCVARAAGAYSEQAGRAVRIYKNNTDFHGASYGTHENYLVPREVGWEPLYRAVLPMLVARQVLCGAGKVGSESGPAAAFQLSQRADFFVEPLNAETLFRRPIFNTRDEPHANPERWMRLHVIAGDANMSLKTTARKLALVKLAIQLAVAGRAPNWRLRDPVAAFQSISRDESREFSIALEDGSSTSAYAILESYFSAAEEAGWPALRDHIGPDRQADPFLAPFTELFVIEEGRALLRQLQEGDPEFSRHVDWAAKRDMLLQISEELGIAWGDPRLQAYDLAYHDIEESEGLYWALAEMGAVDDAPMPEALAAQWLAGNCTRTRSEIRSYALRHFGGSIRNASWGTLTFEVDGRHETVAMDPGWRGIPPSEPPADVVSFMQWMRGNDDSANR